MDSKRSALFLVILGSVASLWAGGGFFLVRHLFGEEAAWSFLQVLFFTCLDLVALVVVSWKLFFSRLTHIAKKIDLFLWFVFKLVCLAFLAITLKRLTNAPSAAILLGIGFIGVGPIVAGLIFKAMARDKV